MGAIVCLHFANEDVKLMSEFSELVSGGARLDRSPVPAWLPQNFSLGGLFLLFPF